MQNPLPFRPLLAGFAVVVATLTVTAPARPVLAAEKGTVYLTPGAARAEGEQIITAATMRRYLTFIASDALEGRDTPSPGLDAAAQFIAFNLSRFGLKPMGDDGTYFQKIALQRVRPDLMASSLTLQGRPLRAGDDFLPATGQRRGGSGTIPDAPLVYVGNGWQIPARKIDAYAGGIDVKNKVMVVSGRFLPQGVRFNDLTPGPQGADSVLSPANYAARHGAVGIIYLPTSQEEYARSASGATTQGRGGFVPLDPALAGRRASAPPAATAVPALELSPEIARRLFEGEKQNGEAVLAASESGDPLGAFDLSADKKVSFTPAYKEETIFTQNVVAVLEGSDPVLKSQYIAFGAHYDHVGVGTPDKNGDRIFNGADDDGSGTTALLTLAEAFSHANARPRRSVLFVWHCGEEKGLWGSSFYTDHPTIPLKQVVSQLNIDMIGRSKKAGDSNPRNANLSGPDEVYVIGSKAMSSKLGQVSDQVNAGYLHLNFNFRYDDPSDPNRFFYRSDHFNYARRGVPIIFYFDGVHEDYHQRGDEVSKIDFAKMEKIVRTVYLTAVTLADLDAPPAVDRKLPFSVE